MWDADVVVVGSGFGGAASALRLAEQGHRVIVLEAGRRLSSEDLLAARQNLRRYFYLPELGLNRGFFWQRVFRDVAIIGARGVGGGSIVWAAVLLEPAVGFFADPEWSHLNADWKAELAPHYERAAQMLGRTTCPTHGPMDDHLLAAAKGVGAEATFGPVPVGIYFGKNGVTVPDPFFNGDGPERTGCQRCGGCLVGCPFGSKNSLDLNYLYLAERIGVEIRPEHRVRGIKPVAGGGYEVAISGKVSLRARRVVLAAGVLGTLEILFRCRDELGTLPDISPMLGRRVRTNSEAVTAVLDPDPFTDLSQGPTISSDFNPDEHTHVTQNRYVGGGHMRFQLGPMVDGHDRRKRAARTLAEILRHPVRQFKVVRAPNFEKRLSALTVMQDHDNQVAFRFGRSPLRPWLRVLRSRSVVGERSPSYLPIANEVTRAFAEASGGTPLNLLAESLGGRSITAHILGGACMGADASEGVIDSHHEVFGHPGLYVVDASAIPANLGVNPSLTITALAERFAGYFPPPPTQDGEHDNDRGVESDAAVARASDRPPIGRSAVPISTWVERYKQLSPPPLDKAPGTYQAEFVGGPFMRWLAPRGLGVVGLPRWFGKRLAPADADHVLAGVNLVRSGHGGFEERLPMTARLEPSRLDGFATLAVTYDPKERLPWRRVRDELRVLDDATFLGVTIVEIPGLRTRATPFLLKRIS